MLKIKQKISDICKKLSEKGLSPGFSGNVSVKLKNGILVSPSCFSLGDVEPDDLVLVGFDGKSIDTHQKPTSEVLMHLKIYEKRPDLSAIIHCHAPKSSAFAVAGIALDQPILAENVLMFGEIPLAEYAMPSSAELAQIVSEYFVDHEAVLMANHGVVTAGKNIEETFYKMETIEYCSEVYLYSKLLGNTNLLDKTEVEKIISLRKHRS